MELSQTHWKGCIIRVNGVKFHVATDGKSLRVRCPDDPIYHIEVQLLPCIEENTSSFKSIFIWKKLFRRAKVNSETTERINEK